MGYIYENEISAAAEFLVDTIPKNDGTVSRSRFYDGSEETFSWVRQELVARDAGFREGAEEHSIDVAAAQLQQFGVVSLKTLEDVPLADGLPDYTMTLTDKGRDWVSWSIETGMLIWPGFPSTETDRQFGVGEVQQRRTVSFACADIPPTLKKWGIRYRGVPTRRASA